MSWHPQIYRFTFRGSFSPYYVVWDELHGQYFVRKRLPSGCSMKVGSRGHDRLKDAKSTAETRLFDDQATSNLVLIPVHDWEHPE